MAAVRGDPGPGIRNQGHTPKVRCFRDLVVWQRAVDLVVEVYRITPDLPASELYGLRAQMQRAAVSVAANIAEGNGRATTGAYVNHLGIAHGSLMELETYLVLVIRLGFLQPANTGQSAALGQQVGRMLQRLIEQLRVHAAKARRSAAGKLMS